jgi:hypothetical protein
MKLSRYVQGARRMHSFRFLGLLLAVAATLAAVIGLFAGAGAAAGAAAPQNTSPPTISGTPQEGMQLSGDKGVWSGAPTTYDYFWMRCDKNGGSCSGISGANALTYSLGSADVGNTVRFKVRATNADGSTSASSVPSAVIAAAAKPALPVNTSPPTISGTAQAGQRLTGANGTWSGSPTDFNLFWMRCNKRGNACANIAGENTATYTVTSVDVGNTLRFKVGAANQAGRTFASSNQTEVVTTAAPPPPPAGSTITVDKVSLPDLLIIDKLSFSPNPTRSHGPIVARFHVSDTHGHSIQGALVYALGLPYSWVRNAAEVATDATGWATITLQPTAAMPLQRGGSLVIFVRARKPGDNLLSGVSTRRLVQEGVSR